MPSPSAAQPPALALAREARCASSTCTRFAVKGVGSVASLRDNFHPAKLIGAG